MINVRNLTKWLNSAKFKNNQKVESIKYLKKVVTRTTKCLKRSKQVSLVTKKLKLLVCKTINKLVLIIKLILYGLKTKNIWKNKENMPENNCLRENSSSENVW